MVCKQTDMPLHLFHHGENFYAYKTLGAHFTKKGKKNECVFRVWAPRAVAVNLVGEFNGWDENATPMERMIDGETFEVYVSGVKQFDAYKFCITTADGRKLFKADPYAFHSETPGSTSSNSSKVYDLSGYNWGDGSYLENQKTKNVYESPVNIYEVNLMSWKKHEDGSTSTYASKSFIQPIFHLKLNPNPPIFVGFVIIGQAVDSSAIIKAFG